MHKLINVLENFAHDSELFISQMNWEHMVLTVSVDALGGEVHNIILPHVDHIDISPYIHLGSVHFGDVSLLPPDYLSLRRKGYEGDEASLRVMKVRDDDGNTFFVIYCGEEVFEPHSNEVPLPEWFRR